MALPDQLTTAAIYAAATKFDTNELPQSFAASTKFDVLIGSRRYPPKAITSLATQEQEGRTLRSGDFSAGADSKCFRLLRSAGFRVVPKTGQVPFIPGSRYKRRDIKDNLGTSENTTKGDWATGYHFHRDPEAGIDGWWFVFAATGSSGRTGHDYANQFADGRLQWESKGGKRLGQSQIDSLLSEVYPVLIFTREDDRAPFVYRGLGTPQTIEDSSPVRVSWYIGDLSKNAHRDNREDPLDEYQLDSQDGRSRVVRIISERRGQSEFRKQLLERHLGKCAITGCDIVGILEAAHVNPYRGENDNHPANGILLRADIHTLFDLNLLGINPATLCVDLKPNAQRDEYRKLLGKPIQYGESISKPALMVRWQQFQYG